VMLSLKKLRDNFTFTFKRTNRITWYCHLPCAYVYVYKLCSRFFIQTIRTSNITMDATL